MPLGKGEQIAMRDFLSAPYWIHVLVDTIIGQVVWWIVSMIIGTPILARSIIAGAILIAVIFAVALYLPRISPSAKGKVQTESARLIDSMGWLDGLVNDQWHNPTQYLYSRLIKAFWSSASEIGLVTEWFNCSVFDLRLSSVSGEVLMGDIGHKPESLGHQIMLADELILFKDRYATTTYHIQVIEAEQLEQFRKAIATKKPLMWKPILNLKISTVGFDRSFTMQQNQPEPTTIVPVNS